LKRPFVSLRSFKERQKLRAYLFLALREMTLNHKHNKSPELLAMKIHNANSFRNKALVEPIKSIGFSNIRLILSII